MLGVWLWGKATSGASAAANRGLFRRGAHRKARILKDSPLHFRTTGVADQVRDWILGHLPIEPARPSAIAGLYVDGQDDETTRISFGALVGGDRFTFDLDIVQRGAQAVGSVSLVAWKEADGVMVSPERLERIYREVGAAVRRADPSAVVEDPFAVDGTARR